MQGSLYRSRNGWPYISILQELVPSRGFHTAQEAELDLERIGYPGAGVLGQLERALIALHRRAGAQRRDFRGGIAGRMRCLYGPFFALPLVFVKIALFGIQTASGTNSGRMAV